VEENLVRHHVAIDRLRARRPQKALPAGALGKQTGYRQRRRSLGRDLRRLGEILLLCLTVAALSLLFVRGYQALLTSSLLSVMRIQVNGCKHLQPETVIQQAGIHPGDNILALDLEGSEVCGWLNSIGVNCALLKYRVPARPGGPRYAAPLQAAQRTIGLVRYHAHEWQIDPQRIGVLGFSAGGHLAAAASTNRHAPKKR